jgi:hypothetical protein
MRDSPFLAVDEYEQWYSKRRDTDGKKGRWKGRVVTFAKLLHPPLSCQTLYYFFLKRSLQTFSGEAARQTESEAPCTSFLFLSFIKEGFDSPQRQGVTLRHLDQTTAVAQWLRYCATNLKVSGSIPDGVIGIFH